VLSQHSDDLRWFVQCFLNIQMICVDLYSAFSTFRWSALIRTVLLSRKCLLMPAYMSSKTLRFWPTLFIPAITHMMTVWNPNLYVWFWPTLITANSLLTHMMMVWGPSLYIGFCQPYVYIGYTWFCQPYVYIGYTWFCQPYVLMGFCQPYVWTWAPHRAYSMLTHC